MALVTNSDYIDLLMSRLGARQNPRLRSMVEAELQLMQANLEQGSFLPWFLQQESSTPLVVGQTSYDLPSGFLREVESFPWELSGNDIGTPVLKKKQIDWLLEKCDEEAEGTPVYYGVSKDWFLVYPAADITGYSVAVRGYFSQATITDSNAAANSWLMKGAGWLLNEVGHVVASTHIANPQLAAQFRTEANRAKMELISATEARLATNIDYSDQGI